MFRERLRGASVRSIDNHLSDLYVEFGARYNELDLCGNSGRYTPPVGKHTVGTPCPSCGDYRKIDTEDASEVRCPR